MDIDAMNNGLVHGDQRLKLNGSEALKEKVWVDVSAVWVKPKLGIDGQPAPAHNFGANTVLAADAQDLASALGDWLLLSEPVEYLRWRVGGSTTEDWADVEGPVQSLPAGVELLLGIGAFARTPVPPRTELVQVGPRREGVLEGGGGEEGRGLVRGGREEAGRAEA